MCTMTNNDLQLLYSVMTEYYHCTFRLSETRTRDITDKRAMFAAIARHYGAKYADIAQFLYLKSHATVIHATKVIIGYMDVYPAFKKQFNDIVEEFEFRKTVGVLAQ